MITVITGSNKELVMKEFNNIDYDYWSIFPETEKGAVEIFNWCNNVFSNVVKKQTIKTIIVTLNIDVVNCIAQLCNKNAVHKKFILVTADGVENCGTNVEPVFKEFNKIYTLLDSIWEEEKQ
jgi:hypothetical protein